MITTVIVVILRIQSWFIKMCVDLLDPPHYERYDDDDQWDL